MKKFVVTALICSFIGCVGLLTLLLLPEAEYRVTLVKESLASSEFQTVNEEKDVLTNLDVVDTSSLSNNTLFLPRVNKKISVSNEPTEDEGLRHGVWIDYDSDLPGSNGVTVIAGHRLNVLPTYNASFYLLDKIQKNDLIQLNWQGSKYTYQVEEIKEIMAEELTNLNDNDPGTLILYTCTPIFSNEKRLIVTAREIEV